MVELRSIAKSFGQIRVLENVSLILGRGERLVVTGPSGCGKTTLLRIVAGLERPDKGEVLIDGDPDLPPHRRGIAVAFQSPALWPNMTLLGNALFAAPTGSETRARQILEEVGILDECDRYPYEVSGGQAQRAAIVRALAARRRLVLLDEPFAHLPPELQEAALTVIDRSAREDDAALVLVTHDTSVALRLGAEIMELREIESRG